MNAPRAVNGEFCVFNGKGRRVLYGFTVLEKKRFRHSFYWSSAVWSLGNAFAGAIVVLLILFHFGKMDWGTAAVWAFTAPIVGNLCRIFSPFLHEKFQDPRRLCITFYRMQAISLIASVLIFWCTPENSSVFVWPFLVLWYTSNILENLAYVTLLVWARSLFHRKTLGRFFAFREFWRLMGEVCILFLCGFLLNTIREIWFDGKFSDAVLRSIYPGFLLCAGFFTWCGASFLQKIPNRESSSAELTLNEEGGRPSTVRNFLGLLKDPVFRRVMLYGILFAFFTQAEQPIRSKFQHSILHGDGLVLLWLTSGLTLVTRGGQMFAAPFAGRIVDRLGTLRVMAVSQMMTAFALLFYFWAVFVPDIWLLYGASAVWSCYVGLNTALPKFLVEAQDQNPLSRAAVYGPCSALGGIAGIIFGKTLLNHFGEFPNTLAFLFLAFFALRLLLSLPLFSAEHCAKRK